MLAETLAPGRPANIALSVVLVSMLNTTGEFNALQVLVDSQKFDLNEPLLFHLPFYDWGVWKLSLVAVDAIGVALQIDFVSNIYNPNSYPLLTKLVHRDRSSRLDTNLLDMDIRLMELCLINNGTTILNALRANGALSFLWGISRNEFDYFTPLICLYFYEIHEYEYVYERHRRQLSLLKVLCRMGLTLNADISPAYCYKYTEYTFYQQHTRINRVTDISSTTFLQFLIKMFDIQIWNRRKDRIEYFLSEFLSNGWSLPKEITGPACLSSLARHEQVSSRLESSDGGALFRIFRQLLALGLFREPASEQFWSAQCEDCCYENEPLITRRQCVVC